MSVQPQRLTAQKIPTKFVLLAMLFPLFMAFAYPGSYVSAFSDPHPRDMKVEVIETTPQASQVSQKITSQAEDAADVSTVADVQTAKDDVMNLDTRAAYDPSNGNLYVASAGSRQATQAAEGIFTQVAQQSQTQLSVQDLKAPTENDSTGTSFLYLVIGAAIAGYMSAAMLNAFGPLTRMRTKLTVQALLAVAAGVIETAISFEIYGSFDGQIMPMAMIVTGMFLTAAIVQLGFVELIGPIASVIGLVLFVILGIPATGVAVSFDMMPGFFRVMHQLLPTGASSELMRRSLYFDGHGVGPQILVLAVWLIIGAGLLWTSTLRSRPATPFGVEEDPRPARDPDEPLLTAYEHDEATAPSSAGQPASQLTR